MVGVHLLRIYRALALKPVMFMVRRLLRRIRNECNLLPKLGSIFDTNQQIRFGKQKPAIYAGFVVVAGH
jgi:hypothetical protein